MDYSIPLLHDYSAQQVIRAAVIHELQSPADEVRRRGDSE